jgi:hypothetical protein
MLELDLNGNLKPYQSIESTLEEVEAFFVAAFPASNTRKQLFDNYKLYTDALKVEIGAPFFQYLNGSFVTRKLNPNDIDLVTFIDYQILKSKEPVWKKFKDGNLFLGIDGYIERVYPENHPYFIRFQTDLLYWNDLFTKSYKGQPKGYIKINFNYDGNTK